MIKIATPHFDFESKKEYMKPSLKVVQLQHRQQILTGSPYTSIQTTGDGPSYDSKGGGSMWDDAN